MRQAPSLKKMAGIDDSGNKKGYELCMFFHYFWYDIFEILHTTTVILFGGISLTLLSKPRRHVNLDVSCCAVNGENDSLKLLF